VLLVISCPCALVISVPLGYFGGIGGASRRGVLVKGANFLDALARLRTVAFDKTGTLTEGVFEVTEAAAFEGASEEELLDLAAHAEAFSNHPVALSILRAHGGPVDRRRVAECEEIAGLGVKAVIDGRRVIAGNDRMLHEEGVPHQSCQTAGTTVFVAADGRLLGRITIADRIRPDAAEAVRRLRSLGVERLVMLTGDDPRVAGEVAATLGLDEARSGLLPEQKVAAIEELMARPGAGPVAYAGDGTNDAPVLVRADVGIAMGGLGSDAAIEAADVVVMDDRPSRIAEAVRIARRTRAIVKQNIAFALGVKGVFVLLDRKSTRLNSSHVKI